ncbi:MAG: tRNA (adenosine(37)-N6)-threonylcarbamoyltransferase complex transferase subunit TsaD [Ardenticatenales bacterium]|nr:tRNA (adenosine(37)-N6)-threonylcarbamoyltransferase complex transferase subunit TsaD [Ardenticatenales bacterium]
MSVPLGVSGHVHGSRLILGIETSCDETAAAVVEAGRVVWSNVVASQAMLHAPYGGVFPEVASRQHVRDIVPVIETALLDAGITLADVAAIAVTAGPGLAGALLVGANAAKGLAIATGKPLIAVNHLAGHLASNWLHSGGVLHERPAGSRIGRGDVQVVGADAVAVDGDAGPRGDVDPATLPTPPLPHLALIVSGGHTHLFRVRALDDMTLLAATRDDAAGEAFDKAARILGLGYPGGPAIQRAAEGGDPARFPLPVARTDDGDWSFSGLKSALARRVAQLSAGPADRLGGAAGTDVFGTGHATPGATPAASLAVPPAAAAPLPVADLAASFQAAVVRAVVERLRRAVAEHHARAIAVSGGVSANSTLRAALATAFDVPVLFPPLALCTDNAAMIAAAGWFAWERGAAGDGLGIDVRADWGLA